MADGGRSALVSPRVPEPPETPDLGVTKQTDA